MSEDLGRVRTEFMQGMGEISRFWGFSPVLGQMYGLLYLQEEPMTAGVLGETLGISKGNVSMTLRSLERWGMIRRSRKVGERKELYEAETDFGRIFVNVLMERRNKDFDRSLGTVTRCLEQLRRSEKTKESGFIKDRLLHMQRFFKTVDTAVMSLLKLIKPGA
jgi:DNA-binding transcriptional regulator GbsR (MarR family)